MNYLPLFADILCVRFHSAVLRRIRNEVHVNTTREVLTVKQVAEFLQVSTDMVYRLAARGELPGRKVGRIWRFTRTAIEDYLSEDTGAGSLRDSNGDGPTSHEAAPVATGIALKGTEI